MPKRQRKLLERERERETLATHSLLMMPHHSPHKHSLLTLHKHHHHPRSPTPNPSLIPLPLPFLISNASPHSPLYTPLNTLLFQLTIKKPCDQFSTMSSGCKSVAGCVDARVPVRATYVNLYKWPESDAEFVRGLTEKSHAEYDAAARGNTNNARVIGRISPATCRFGPSPAVVDSYSCRQIFLKSYTFTKKKETVSEKTMRCFGKVRERAACGCPRSDSGEFTTDDGATFIGRRATNDQNQKNKKTSTNAKKKKMKKKKSKGCVKRLKEASYSALSSIFHGLLSCGVGVDVEDQRFEGS